MSRPKKILVVEEARAAREAMAELLALEGFEVFCAATAGEGMQQYHQAKPDLVVTAVKLPGESGLNLCRKISELGETPVVALSARGHLTDRATYEGASGTLTKPVDFSHLLELARRLLGECSPRLQTAS